MPSVMPNVAAQARVRTMLYPILNSPYERLQVSVEAVRDPRVVESGSGSLIKNFSESPCTSSQRYDRCPTPVNLP